jgi:8-oxo-dGTP pyrophosphatase MutT (NUDIX family)
MLALLDVNPACLERTTYPAHFTGSALVVDADGSRVLLQHHRKPSRWLHFGVHCDGDEDILRVARREAQEKSGIWGLIVASQAPIDLQIYEIPSRGPEPRHFHYDVRFLLIAPEYAVSILSVSEEDEKDGEDEQGEEASELRWFNVEELVGMELDDSLRRLIAKARPVAVARRHSQA